MKFAICIGFITLKWGTPLMRFGLFCIFIILCICSLLLGAEQIQWSTLFSFSHESWLTLTASRIPRLITIVLTGIGLAVCGVILQHIVRNKFVEPETSGGLDAAKLGILVSLTLVPVTSTLSKMIFAIIFCFIASLIYIAIIRRIRFRNTVLVPVIGLMYGSVLSALAEFYAYRFNILQSMQGWLLGDFSKIVQGHYEVIYIIFPIVVLTYLFAHRFTVISTTVITVGAIPFVGLVVPNLVALKYGENLAKTLPIVALGGASLLLICDILGRSIIYPFEVPIGLTAGGVGGIIFLILILREFR
ncbi:iron ABC transporter permease [Acinetobacter baumannii]|nr:iron ABC transporter permease [Acinetobacter baumannii]